MTLPSSNGKPVAQNKEHIGPEIVQQVSGQNLGLFAKPQETDSGET